MPNKIDLKQQEVLNLESKIFNLESISNQTDYDKDLLSLYSNKLSFVKDSLSKGHKYNPNSGVFETDGEIEAGKKYSDVGKNYEDFEKWQKKQQQLDITGDDKAFNLEQMKLLVGEENVHHGFNKGLKHLKECSNNGKDCSIVILLDADNGDIGHFVNVKYDSEKNKLTWLDPEGGIVDKKFENKLKEELNIKEITYLGNKENGYKELSEAEAKQHPSQIYAPQLAGKDSADISSRSMLCGGYCALMQADNPDMQEIEEMNGKTIRNNMQENLNKGFSLEVTRELREIKGNIKTGKNTEETSLKTAKDTERRRSSSPTSVRGI